jgi:hypothetical protein
VVHYCIQDGKSTVFASVGVVGAIYTSRMSFADIRAKRQVKEEKSLVVSSSSAGFKPSSAEAPSEPLFGTLPSSTETQSDPERGRGIYAKESFKKGEVEHHRATSHTHLCAGGTIFSTKPTIYVLSTKNLEHFCSSCVSPAPATGLKRCTQCKNILYCNAVRFSPLFAMY